MDFAVGTAGGYADAMHPAAIKPSNPAISVCVPTYNGMPYLPRTIESVLRQSRGDFELIVVNDASTDGTAEYLSTLTDPRIRIEHNPANLGAPGTWTRSLDLATAPYVKLLCHDDTLATDCLAYQLAALEATPKAILCTVWRRVIDANDRVLMTRRAIPSGRPVIDGEEMIRTIVTRGSNVIGEPSAVVFRRDAWPSVRPYSCDNLYMIDVSLWIKLLPMGAVVLVPKPLCDFRISPTSLSTKLVRKQGREARRFFRMVAHQHHVARWRLWLGLVRATFAALLRQIVIARHSRRATASSQP